MSEDSQTKEPIDDSTPTAPNSGVALEPKPRPVPIKLLITFSFTFGPLALLINLFFPHNFGNFPMDIIYGTITFFFFVAILVNAFKQSRIEPTS